MKKNTQYIDNTTICALSTKPGGAIGIIRVAGEDSIKFVNDIFTKNILAAKANTFHYGEIVDINNDVIDQVIISIWRAPHSYTGENVVEISCHGSEYILKKVIYRLCEIGCRQAKPGEFTLRAYLNGKMDLTQAEAVAELIASTNKASHKVALSQLKGHFTSKLLSLRQKLLTLNSLLELELDFSDHEELEFVDRTELENLTVEIDKQVDKLIASFATGQAMKKGIPVAIIGNTNVGKSTLLNKLLNEDKAIVSDIHGTTRDVVSDSVNINGINFLFIDTAGFRETEDYIENLGIERTIQELDTAQIVLWVVDKDIDNYDIKEIQSKCSDKKLIVVRNKIDNKDNIDKFNSYINNIKSEDKKPYYNIYTSGKYNIGIEDLKKLVYIIADIPEITENTLIVTSARHYDALLRASNALNRVKDSLEQSLSADFIAEDLKDVLSILGEITGQEITSQETLNNIFKNFCIGK